MPKVRGEFARSLGLEYVLSATSKDYSFYTISDMPDSLLVSIDAIRARVSFPLDPFVVDYLQASGLIPIQLTPNSWAYLLGFTGFARWVLGEMPSIALFWSIFTLALINKANFDCMCMLSSIDKDAKGKFKVLLSKICE